MIFLLLTAAAWAVPTPDAIQVRTFPSAVRFTEQYLEAQDQQLLYDDLSGEVSCYDLVGITDFNLDVPIDEVTLALGDGTLDVTVRFGSIYGADMLAYGTDSDVLDGCISFETDLRYIDIQNATVTASVALLPPSVFDLGPHTLDFEWVEPPVVTGDIDMDLAWVPDGLVLYFFEEAVFTAVSDALSDAALPMLEQMLGETVYGGEYEGLAAGFQLAEASLSPDQLSLYLDGEISALETGICEIGTLGGAEAAGGRDDRLPFDRVEDADLAVGLTEAFLNDALHASWEAGFFCVQPEAFSELVDDIALLVDPDVGRLEGWATLNSPAAITVNDGAMFVDIEGLEFTMMGKSDGQDVEVLDLVMDIRGDAIPGFSSALTSMTVSMRDMDITFVDFQSDHLLSDSEMIEGLVRNAVERWASTWAEDALDNTVLFSSLYYAYDVALLMDRSEARDGGLELYFKLYDINDPAVDTVPPDTVAVITDQKKKTVTIAVSGTDDRTDPLFYAYQLDGEGWSQPFAEESFTVELAVGAHEVEVVARDRWLNEDPTPVLLDIEIAGSKTRTEVGCLGCATGGTAPGWWVPLLALLAAFRRGDRHGPERR